MNIEEKISTLVAKTIYRLSGQPPEQKHLVLQPTRREFKGDLTLVVFPFLKALRQSPEKAAETLGEAIREEVEEVSEYQVVKGFLNLTLSDDSWLKYLEEQSKEQEHPKTLTVAEKHPDKKMDQEAKKQAAEETKTAEVQEPGPILVEYSSPNTNKPLHLGHIRNNLLGYSVSLLLEAAGHQVVKVNLVNDRGIHICKSMLAWMRYGKGETPESIGKKGDKLVGDYYVRFETELRKQVQSIISGQGLDEEQARDAAPLMQEARELLRRWEARDPEVMQTWSMMNSWVYQGFDATYERLGVAFDKIYYESDTYLLGRETVLKGLDQGALYKKEDGSVWAGLADQQLDDKLLLRADGTSVYMTQDIGTAQLRYDDCRPQQMIYVVGNEQNHHFTVLKKVLQKLNKTYAGTIHHLSYGMVELPGGRMKSREGTVVDADDLMDEMVATARKTTEALGKTQDIPEGEKEALYEMIGLGALKYFILKVDPKKNMLFNPEESIDFNGNTGPFIQYTHARICSVLRKAGEERLRSAPSSMVGAPINNKEKQLLKLLREYPGLVQEAADNMSPARVANHMYEVAKAYNQFYHEHSILNEPEQAVSDFRLCLSQQSARILRKGMALLGISLPDMM